MQGVHREACERGGVERLSHTTAAALERGAPVWRPVPVPLPLPLPLPPHRRETSSHELLIACMSSPLHA